MRKGKQPEKYKTHVTTPEFYDYYANFYFREFKPGRKNGIIHRNKYYVDRNTYSKIIGEINMEVRDLILNEAFDFLMPARLGLIGIRKKRLSPWINDEGQLINPLPVDWGATRELWDEDKEAEENRTLVRHRNKHSNGYIARWYYTTYRANFRWKSAYSFIPCRDAKKALSEIMLDEDRTVDYYLL